MESMLIFVFELFWITSNNKKCKSGCFKGTKYRYALSKQRTCAAYNFFFKWIWSTLRTKVFGVYRSEVEFQCTCNVCGFRSASEFEMAGIGRGKHLPTHESKIDTTYFSTIFYSVCFKTKISWISIKLHNICAIFRIAHDPK